MSSTEPPAAEAAPMYVLEADVPLSQSMVWRIQRTFYGDQGVEAWTRSNVPQGITTSPNIARAYAHVASAFLQDIQSTLDPGQPVYIVELGAGSGRFAYRFLKYLTGRPLPRFVYVMTDASASVVDFWRDNPRLRVFADAGVLDYAHFDVLDPQPLTLLNSGATLRPGDVANPLVFIGNYIFDTIPQDAYTVTSGQLFANLVTFRASTPELDLAAPDSRVRIGVSFSTATTPTDPKSDADPLVRDLLRGYAQKLDATTVLIPRAGLACLRFLRDLSGGRALCLIGDFGETAEEDLAGHGPPGFGAGGALWLSVNFHALGEYAQRLGGRVRHPAERHIRLNISMLLFGSPTDTFAKTDDAYSDAIDLHGPDAISVLSRAIANAEHVATLGFDALLALLRTTNWDPDYLLRCVPRLIEEVPNAEERLRADVIRGLRTAWDLYFPLGEKDDLPFAIAAVLYSLEQYEEALQFFDISLRDFGEDPRTTINLALTHYRLGRLPETLHWLDRTLALDPDQEMARNMRADVEADLARGQ